MKAVSGGGDRLSGYRAPGPSVTDRSQNLHSIKARETKARRREERRGVSEPGAAVTAMRACSGYGESHEGEGPSAVR